MAKGKILVVEDERQLREICHRTLGGLGFDVQTAGNGEEALALFEGESWDFVLTDIQMPGPIDGPKLAEEIRRRSPTTDVVLMTGHPTLETAIATLRRGAYDYLLKPFDPGHLESVVTRCFEKRRLSGELDREKLMRRELEAAYAELQKVERLKDAFLSRLRHELRTPLAKITAAASLLAPESLDPRSDGRLRGILQAGTSRLQEVVEQLLLFADAQAPDFKLDVTEVRPEEVVQGLVESLSSVWKERKLTVEISFETGSRRLRGDAELLKTAFKHLLLNAVHFNKDGGKISIRGREDSGALRVTFSDQGTGIPEDRLSRVFDGFYQIAEYMTRKVGGLGLGLAIVRRIAEAHGGSISVKSREGLGSDFTLTLPLDRA